MENTEEMEDQVRRLTRTVDEMRERMAALEVGEPKQNNGSGPSSRRGFLRLGAAAALGAVGWAAAKVVPASAATGDPMVLGTAMSAAASTTVAGTGAGTPVQVFAAKDATFTPADLATAGGFAGTLQGLGFGANVLNPAVEGVDGWAQGTRAFGVYGLTDSGTGVVGESNTGIGLYARRSGRIGQDGMVTLGPGVAPAYSPNNFEQVRDANGVLWINNGSGAWRRVNTARFDTADGTGGFFKPFRLVDTRSGSPKAGLSTWTYPVTGQGTGASTIPTDAIAIAGNLTAVAYNSSGYLAIFPAGTVYQPGTDPSSVNFVTGQFAIANSFIVGLGTGGAVSVFVYSPGVSHFIIDITGYFQ
jgi:hypothetical protein